MNIKTLADLKRYLQPGIKLDLVIRHNQVIPDDMKRRVVKKVQSNAVCFDVNGQESWMVYGKSGEYVFLDDGFKVRGLEYKYIKEGD